ncbi:RNI-like protein [Trametopsis cervina]|nr:RNI-like protein [Trametopsis cervina]
MSRRNNVRGPTSALTEFLREQGITPTTVARRAQTRTTEQPVAGPSNEAEPPLEEDLQQHTREYASDNLDDSEAEKPPQKKRKVTKAQEARLKAQAKKSAKKDDDNDSEDEDAYTRLSKMSKDISKPAVGSFCQCAKCEKQFTVTKYTMAANPLPGYLCHPCYKASGADPFKKPSIAKKRKQATEKRSVAHFEERRIGTLASMCVRVISGHIDDVEALGDIGSMNLDRIAKAIAKDRSLTAQNVSLFYDIQNTTLTLYDATNLLPPAMITLAALNPNLVSLRLDYCGCMNNDVVNTWATSLPMLRRLELLGPFLVHANTWQTFFQKHQDLEGFLITQSPRFDITCAQFLVQNCTKMKELRLKEIGQMSDDFISQLKTLGGQLTYLDLSYPGDPEALSTEALVGLMESIGQNLLHLDLSGNVLLSDGFLYQGLKPNMRNLKTLVLSGLPDLTDAGVAEFFDTWEETVEDGSPNPPLISADFSRCHELAGLALTSLLKHSGPMLEELNINGWKATPQKILADIAKNAPKLMKLDIGWCREADDWVIKELMERCTHISDVKVWGCQRVTESCPRKRGVVLQGVESFAAT